MKSSVEQDRIKKLLAETITLLCKNGLTFKTEFSIEALVGITLDQEDVMLLSIKETIKNSVDSSADEFMLLDDNDCFSEVDKGLASRSVTDLTPSLSDEQEVDEKSPTFEQITEMESKATADEELGDADISRDSLRLQRDESETTGVEIDRLGHNSSKQSFASRPSSQGAADAADMLTQDSYIDTKCIERNMQRRRSSGSSQVHTVSKNVLNASQTSSAISEIKAGDSMIGPDIVQIKQEVITDGYEDFGANVGVLAALQLQNEYNYRLSRRSSGVGQGHRDPHNVEQEGGRQDGSKLSSNSNSLTGVWTGEREMRSGGSSGVGSANEAGFTIGGVLNYSLPIGAGPTGNTSSPHQGSWRMPAGGRRVYRAGMPTSAAFCSYKLRCPFCQKGFSNSYNLRGHLVQHTGIKEHRCPLCQREYTYKQNLKLHMRHIHLIEIT